MLEKNTAIVNGVKIYGFSSKEELMEYTLKEKGILIAINAEKIINATDETRSVINNNIGYADGIGAIIALKRKGIKNTVRVPGVELWLNIIEKCYQTHSFYLVGGTEYTINTVIEKLRNDFEGINILGYRNGYIKIKEERNALIKDIEEKKPDFVFVAMGSPKQELLMQEMQKKHQAVYQGLGGSFDVYVGKAKRSPQWMTKLGLEWVYRCLRRPLNNGKRFFKAILFIYRLYI